MSELEVVRVLPENPIPSILTTSLRIILSHYKERIVRLTARGGETPSKTITLNADYGVTFNPGRTGAIGIDYIQKRGADGTIDNPFDNSATKTVLSYLDENLPKYKGHLPDIPASYVLVEIQDDEIAEMQKTETSTFDLTFSSDPPEPNMRKRMLELGSEYYEEELGDHWKVLTRGFGFKARNLNCKELMETSERFNKPKNEWNPIIQWKGYLSQDVPKSPIAVAGRIRDVHLPPEPFGRLKTYILTRTNRLVLDGVR